MSPAWPRRTRGGRWSCPATPATLTRFAEPTCQLPVAEQAPAAHVVHTCHPEPAGALVPWCQSGSHTSSVKYMRCWDSCCSAWSWTSSMPARGSTGGGTPGSASQPAQPRPTRCRPMPAFAAATSCHLCCSLALAHAAGHRRKAGALMQAALLTGSMSTPLQAAFVLSVPRRRPVDETQETLRTSAFPSTHVKDKWAKNLYIAGVAYGRTVS